MTEAVKEPTLVELKEQLVAAFKDEAKRSSSEFDALVKQLNAKVDETNAKFEAFAKARNAGSLPGCEDEKFKGEKFSFQKLYKAIVTKNWSGAPLEEAVVTEATRNWNDHGKLFTAGTDGAGGYVVPEQYIADVIGLLYADMVTKQAGARALTGLTGVPTVIPRMSAGTTAYWIGSEDTAITDSTATLQQLSLSPKTVAALSLVSQLLLQTSNPSIEQMIKEDMAMQLGIAYDLAALKGTGNNGQPSGLDSAAYSIPTETVSDPATADQLIAMVAKVRGNNGLKGKLGWIMSNADKTEIEQIKAVGVTTTQGAYTSQDSRAVIAGGLPSTILGFPAYVSTQLSDGDIYFGNWDDLILPQWGPLMVDTTNALGFVKAQTHIRTMMFCDVGVRRVNSFCQPA